MSNWEVLDRAAQAAACHTLFAAGASLVGTGAVSVVAAGVGFVPLTAGMLTLLAHEYACGEGPLGGTEPNPNLDGCQQVDGYGDLQVNWQGEWVLAFPPGNNSHAAGKRAVEITDQYVFQSVDSQWVSYIEWTISDGSATSSTQFRSYSEDIVRAAKWRISPTEGTCIRGSNEPQPIPPEATETYVYTDESTNCTYNVTLQGFMALSEGGAVEPVFLIEGASGTRADGGVMGGCNFSPTIYMPGGGGGGGGIPIPVPPVPPVPDDGLPWWVAPILGAVGGAIANQVLDSIGDALAPTFEPATFTLTAPCDVDENGQQLTRTWEFLEGSFQERMNAHQVALMEILQQHLDWKTPTCSDENEKPVLEGEWVTTRWESVEKMPHSGHRLRKQFRYRSKSSLDLGQRSAYWEHFQWEAGDVCVIHKDAWWGTPQIWAASEEEGKRVIRFAAGEAGLDPDQTGKWIVSRSSSPRYGMSGTMKIQLYKGFPWISSRGGASYPNTLAKAYDP